MKTLRMHSHSPVSKHKYHSIVSFIPSQLALCQISAACHPCRPQFLLRMLTLPASSSSSGRLLDVFMAFTSLCTWEGLAVVWNLGNGTGDLLGVCIVLLGKSWDGKCLDWKFEALCFVCRCLFLCWLLLVVIGFMP